MVPEPAMVVYNSFWDWMFSYHATQRNLMIATAVAFACFCVLARRRFPIEGPYISWLFVLALCPFLTSSLYLVMIVDEFLDAGWYEPAYMMGRLQGPTHFAIFGAGLSGLAVGAYSVLHWMSRVWTKRNRVGDVSQKLAEGESATAESGTGGV